MLLPLSLFCGEKWEVALPGKVLAQPIENNGSFVILCDDRRVYSIDSISGRVKWKVRPGGKLKDIKKSPDDSLIVLGEDYLYSLYRDGQIRWKIEVDNPKSIDINPRGDIYILAKNLVRVINRFGSQKSEFKVSGERILSLKNYLILLQKEKILTALNLNGDNVWEREFSLGIGVIKSFNNSIFISSSKNILELSLFGQDKDMYVLEISNLIDFSQNHLGDILLIGNDSVDILNNKYEYKRKRKEDYSLLNSKKVLLETFSDWSIKGEVIEYDNIYYPSGSKLEIEANSPNINPRVWGDEAKRGYLRQIVADGSRDKQKSEFKIIEELLLEKEVLVKYPNFYYYLILASSKLNPLEDCRMDAYRIIGKSRDITFKSFMLADFINEKSYHILPFIVYTLGQFSVDRNGDIMREINRRIDDYYDEKIVINSIYALYYINRYNNDKYLDLFYKGVEKVLNGGYSRKIESYCYKLLETMK